MFGSLRKVGSMRNSNVAGLFSTEDPEKIFTDLFEIGHGSFGAVYYAKNSQTNEIVAIKKMSIQGRHSAEQWEDIAKEVTFLQSLRHVNCVAYKGCYMREETAWLVMEYCLGSASNLIDVHKKPLQEEEIAAICQGALKGLEYLHGRNTIHRDIKAGNILLTDDGTVKLADFGSASIASPAKSFVGTPYWMAPEVILAMDEGQYDGKADIWSLGITCIELAEQKPPLFNMNAMSALYHIAQNDSPLLNQNENWSDRFRNFVNACLSKDPAVRPTATACLQDPFVTRTRPPDVLSVLIKRTKVAVLEQDNLQSQRFQKKILLGIAEGNEDAKEDYISAGEESTEENTSTKSNSVASRGSCDSRTGDVAISNRGQDLDLVKTLATKFMLDDGPAGFNMGAQVGGSAPSQEMASSFSTIRTTSIVSQQHREHIQQNIMREQMSGYKRMRSQHARQLQQLEQRQKIEMEELRQRLEKEHEARLGFDARELELDIQRQVKEKERHDKFAALNENKRRKHIMQMQEQEMKQLLQQQKKDYQRSKEEMRKSMSDVSPRRDTLRNQKDSLKQQHQEAGQCLGEQHRRFLELEIRKFRRRKLLQFHLLEQDLLREHLSKREAHLEFSHSSLMRQDEAIQDLERKHINAVHQLKEELLDKQHQMEQTNQSDYTLRAERELRQRHEVEFKQMPKQVKLQESEIRRQFRDAVKIQEKQYKLLKETMISRTPNKEEQKSILAKLKDDQARRIAMLGLQYEQTIEEAKRHRNVTLDTTQVQEEAELRNRLEEELEVLTSYQCKVSQQMLEQHEREKKEHGENASIRRARLIQKMEEDVAAFKDECAKLNADLHERQQREIEHFDLHSLSMGLDLDGTKEAIVDEKVDGSTLSLSASPSAISLRPRSAHR